MNNRYYCFPDIHGMHSLLELALDFVYQQNPDGGKIIFLGDYIDRGPENLKVLHTVMNPPENWEFICLMGNHEDMFVDAYRQGGGFYHISTARQISGLGMDDVPYYDDRQIIGGIDPKIIEWMENLPLFHIVEKNVFAHAYYDDGFLPEQQLSGTVLWLRMPDEETYMNDRQGFYLTHGHTPRKHGPIQAPNRVNLDAGAVFYGRYVIGEYEYGIKGPVKAHQFGISTS